MLCLIFMITNFQFDISLKKKWKFNELQYTVQKHMFFSILCKYCHFFKTNYKLFSHKKNKKCYFLCLINQSERNTKVKELPIEQHKNKKNCRLSYIFSTEFNVVISNQIYKQKINTYSSKKKYFQKNSKSSTIFFNN
ncbi:hypothetical protein RFI_01844 [Reticulomyxa filosa]|uniref:Uncharacterized protein n=1 Tax=Reticulomyxa filosa TaxID=46433 RepID=X6PAQ4_RETFI|nr:hypothetical protein RFI_01844 [Reticulomyxa filosa]|eukprot:ETO35231.1 hypothetical protein RFI_01844 [Reticulomyxa filosa]